MAGFRHPVNRPASDAHISVAVGAVEAKVAECDDAVAGAAFDIASVVAFMELAEGHAVPVVAEREHKAVRCEVVVEGTSGKHRGGLREVSARGCSKAAFRFRRLIGGDVASYSNTGSKERFAPAARHFHQGTKIS